MSKTAMLPLPLQLAKPLVVEEMSSPQEDLFKECRDVNTKYNPTTQVRENSKGIVVTPIRNDQVTLVETADRNGNIYDTEPDDYRYGDGW